MLGRAAAMVFSPLTASYSLLSAVTAAQLLNALASDLKSCIFVNERINGEIDH